MPSKRKNDDCKREDDLVHPTVITGIGETGTVRTFLQVILIETMSTAGHIECMHGVHAGRDDEGWLIR